MNSHHPLVQCRGRVKMVYTSIRKGVVWLVPSSAPRAGQLRRIAPNSLCEWSPFWCLVSHVHCPRHLETAQANGTRVWRSLEQQAGDHVSSVGAACLVALSQRRRQTHPKMLQSS